MGSSSTPSAPQAPPQATQTDAIQDFIKNRPALFASDQQFQGKEAQQQLELIQEFAGPLGQATREANETINPEVTGLQQQLFGDIKQGLTGDIDPIQKAKFESDLRANIGSNVGSQIGGTALARELFGLGQQKKLTAQNQALSFIGRQPVNQAQNPNVTNSFGQFTPGQALDFTSGNNNALTNIFGTQADIFNTQQTAATAANAQTTSMINAGIGAGGAAAGAI